VSTVGTSFVAVGLSPLMDRDRQRPWWGATELVVRACDVIRAAPSGTILFFPMAGNRWQLSAPELRHIMPEPVRRSPSIENHLMGQSEMQHGEPVNGG
jgi:hypothetical protein